MTGQPASAAPPLSGTALWSRFLERTATNASVKAAVEPLTFEREHAGVLILRAATATEASTARARVSSINDMLSTVAERTLRVDIRVLDAPGSDAERDASSGPAPAPRSPAVDPAAYSAAQSNPLVRRAIELFDARLVDVQDDAT